MAIDGQNELTAVSNPFPGDQEGDRCRAFRGRYPHLRAASADPLFCLTKRLLDAIDRYLPKDWLSREERAFERELIGFCSPHFAGICEDARVSASPLSEDIVSAADIGKGRQSSGTPGDAKPASNTAAVGKERLAEPHEQRRAYAGWLVTNREFLAEREVVRRQRARLGLRLSYVSHPDPDGTLRAFLGRWEIAELHGWELPLPLGPDYAGLAGPGGIERGAPSVQIQIPCTIGVSARYPLGQIIGEQRAARVPAHLAEWERYLRSTRSGPWVDVLRVHFYLDLALRARYGDRLRGRTERLDEAFGHAFIMSADKVKKIRVSIRRRLGHR